jgi:hypothetical protein
LGEERISRRISTFSEEFGNSLYKYHPRTDMYAAVQIHDVFVVHADAARRHKAADRGRIVGAVDGEWRALARPRGLQGRRCDGLALASSARNKAALH